MNEKFLKLIALIFRNLPYFRGKFRIGYAFQRLLMRNMKFQKPETCIRMKKGFKILIDLRSYTHLVPFWCGEYDDKIITKFTSLFKESWVVFDVGANIGYYSIPFSKKLEMLNGELHCFEPLSSNFEVLKKNIARNKSKNIFIHKVGLGEKKEKMGIAPLERGNTANAILVSNNVLKTKKNYKPKEFIEVETLDSFCEKRGIIKCDFIKIDIEGAEIFFIRGGKFFIKNCRPIIYGEFSKGYMDMHNVKIKELWDFCIKNGYEVFKQTRTNTKTTKFSKLEEYADNEMDFLLIPSEMTEADKAKWVN